MLKMSLSANSLRHHEFESVLLEESEHESALDEGYRSLHAPGRGAEPPRTRHPEPGPGRELAGGCRVDEAGQASRGEAGTPQGRKRAPQEGSRGPKRRGFAAAGGC